MLQLTLAFNTFPCARLLASSHNGNKPDEFLNVLVRSSRILLDMITGESAAAKYDKLLKLLLVILLIGKDCTVAIQNKIAATVQP